MNEHRTIPAADSPAPVPITYAPVNYIELVAKVGDYVKAYMEEHANPNLLYHDLSHTRRVVRAATEIARHYGLGGRDLFIVLTAAWFHDLGYYDDLENHEQAGAAQAEAFLKGEGVDEETIAAVTAAIMATRIPQSPSNQLEEIVCDADLYHFGTDYFMKLNKLLRKEMQEVHGLQIPKAEWADSTIHLLASHHYFTSYCKEVLKKKKKANLEKLEERFRAYAETINPMEELLEEQKEEKIAAAANPNEITEKPERGVETLFRIALGTSQRLNEQADSKAHILISVNSIIISVVISLIVRHMEDYPYFAWPVIVLLMVNLATIVFSILATRPKVPSGEFKEEEVNKEMVNLLFFGNFYKMSFDDYSRNMFHVLKNEHLLYSSLIRNLYEQGIVLGQKYRLLKVAYNVFMFGFIISVVGFILAARYLMPGG